MCKIRRKITIKNNHYVQICTTHRKHSQPFDFKYTHAFESKNLTTHNNTLLQKYKKNQTLAQSVFYLKQRTSQT